MEILKKDILKEIEEKSRNNLNRGIDIAVSILKHEFPFITGWDYKHNPESFRLSIYLVLMADMNLASEFYNSPIRNVYRHSDARVAYPFSPLEISTELNEEEKYELFKVIQKSLVEIYDEIPGELRYEFESYSSEKKEPKELYIDGFVFEKPKEDINENKKNEIERNLEAINLILSEISWDGLCEIWVEYNEVDGDYEIRSKSTKRHFDHDDITKELGYLENTLRSMDIRNYIFTPWYVEVCEDEVEFLNEDYSPAGKEITPNSIIVHKSNPIFRDKIMEEGLKVSAGECYKTYVGYGIKCIPAIFATNSTNKRAWFDSTYDDDIWFIDTRMIPDVKWYKDKHFESTKKHIVTFQNIPKEAITLKYEGTGSGDVKTWPKDSPNLYESKDKSTKELITAVLNTLVLPQYEHVICGFEYKEEKRFAGKNGKTINSPSVTVTFIGGYGTRMWPRTQAVQKMYDDLLDEVWDTVWDYTGISVELYSKYVKECGKTNILESTEDTNYMEILQELVEPFKNEDGVCDIKVSYDVEDDMYSVYFVLGTGELNDKFFNVDGIRTYRNKLVRKIKTEINSYLPIQNIYVGSYGTPNCGWKPLNENWYKVPSSDYNSLEKIINLTMKEKYDWWKDIKINTLNYIEMYGDVQIEAELTVDEEWGAKQWREFHYTSAFPGNEGWEDNDDYARVSLGDIIDSWYAEVLREDLKDIFKYTLNIKTHNFSFRNVYLIFE